MLELGDGGIARAIFEGLGGALVSYWYIWLLMAVLAVGLGALSEWARRTEVRRRRHR